ncbi:MAG: hypothetical protein IJZ74_09955 [Clostridia bacterium]|nr:hypothetical protein [Clostridia bacterium]
MKKLIVLCLALLMSFGLAMAKADDRIPVAENDRLALYLKADHCGFDVEDKETGVTWSSSMNDPTFTGKLAGLNLKKANSLLIVNITNLVKGAGSITNAVLLNDKQLSTGYELIENGVRAHYDLGSYRLRLSVDIVLENDTVLVSVPYDQIINYYVLELPKNIVLTSTDGKELAMASDGIHWVVSTVNEEGNTVKKNGELYENAVVNCSYDNKRFQMDTVQLMALWGATVTLDMGYEMVNGSVQCALVQEGETELVQLPGALIDTLAGEQDVFSIVSIDMLPYLCSGSDNADGFLFYPDGSGAILEFQDYAHFKETAQYFNVYGSLEKRESVLDFFDQEDPNVMMPVYGISIGGNAMIAVIEDGAESARIAVNSSTKIVALNSVYANFQYRRGFDDLRVSDARSIKTYDKKAMETDYALRLMFLPEGKDTYSDMAVAYRDYLLNDQGFERRTNEQDVAVDLFMSAPEEGLLFDTQRTVTTLSQADDILDALAEKGIGGVQISLKGWAKGGYGSTPDRFPVVGSIGNNAELTRLMEKAESMGSTLSLTANFVEADKDSWGYSKRNDVVYLSNYAILTNEEEDVFILSPEAMYQKFSDFRKQAEKLDVNGVRFEFLGECVTFNYNSSHYHTSADSLDTYLKMLAEAKESLGHVSVVGGAVALAKQADLMTEIPYDDSGFQFTTTSVPFYQIVMHGVRDYTGTPGNLSSDLERETLRWVEMGYMPYFELTWGSTEELMYTDYQSLFTAQYTAWIDEVAEIARAFSEGDLKAVRTALIIKHECLAADLYKVTYDNGCVVYVNYSNEAMEADGLTIPAKDYLVVKEGVQ